MILAARISNQLLDLPLERPEDVVRHMTCIQAQNYTQHLRAIAARCGCSRSDIEQLYAQGKIVRTRTQRGTIHAVSGQDARRIVDLCASKTSRHYERRSVQLGLSPERVHQMIDEIQAYCSGRQIRTRQEILTHLSQRFGIDMPSNRGYNITCHAASLGLIAMGPITESGKQGYILLSERTDGSKARSPEEALYELTHRYFSGHGHASVDDFVRRSGLTKTQVKKGIALCDDLLYQTEIDGRTYYHHRDTAELGDTSRPQPRIHILPAFDEFLLGYKHRQATVEDQYLRKIDPARNGLFKPTLMIDGQQVATRKTKKRTHERDITIHPFESINPRHHEAIASTFEQYSDFVSKKLQLHFA